MLCQNLSGIEIGLIALFLVESEFRERCNGDVSIEMLAFAQSSNLSCDLLSTRLDEFWYLPST
jgi:hypothetical protein